jgi:hypothetical protein
MMMMLVFLAAMALLGAGCAGGRGGPSGPAAAAGTNAPAADDPQWKYLRAIAMLGANEAVIEDRKNSVVLQEVTDALDVFCGQGAADHLYLVALIGSLPERLQVGDRTRRRIGTLAALIDELGVAGGIAPKDYVAWGGVGCAVREGLKRGLALGQATARPAGAQ